MNCFIYRCSRKDDLYIYLAEKDDFTKVPGEITPDSKLAREDASTVVRNLEEKGFHLQLPRNTSVETIMSKIARGKA